jgi:cation/acetate symporter
MAVTSSVRLVNPRLGTYFGIFSAALASLVLMALMLEQLGVSDAGVRFLMFAGPMALCGALGLLTPASDTNDYFACGRRVPAFFNGLVLAMTALGGASLMAVTGAFFTVGFDALCLSLGICTGLVFMGVLVAPFLRKSGDYTAPSYLGRRFDSASLRIVAAAVMAVPLLLLLAAEARFASYAAAWLTDQPEPIMAVAVVICACAMVIAGGMRSHTWSASAKAIVALAALAVPATIVALMVSNLPLAQMTHGNVLRVITRMEAARNLPFLAAPVLGFEIPGQGLEPLAKRFIQTFGSVGSLAFVLMTLVAAAGTAASPALLHRPGSTPGVHDARKSLGWAVMLAGVVFLTLPAIAVFLRQMLLDQVVGHPADRLPAWFQALEQVGVARVDPTGPTVSFVNISFDRDAAWFALSYAAGFPRVLVYLSLAGAVAAAMGALAASLLAGANILSEDVVHGLRTEPVTDSGRMGTARAALGGLTFVAGWLAVAAPADPLKLFLWSLTVSASAVFPVLILSVWWKRTNALGAMAGMLAGLGVAVAGILLGEAGAWALPGVLAGAIGLPAGFATAVAVSILSPKPGRNVASILQEIRVPGGETLYDRELRLQRLKARAVA